MSIPFILIFQKFLNANFDGQEIRDTVLEDLMDKIFLYDGYFEITGFYSDDRTVIKWNEFDDFSVALGTFAQADAPVERSLGSSD